MRDIDGRHRIRAGHHQAVPRPETLKRLAGLESGQRAFQPGEVEQRFGHGCTGQGSASTQHCRLSLGNTRGNTRDCVNDRPPSSLALVPVGAALAGMLAARGPINPLTLPITDAVGLVLDQDLIVPGPVPPQPIALRAGYAVASSDLVGASPYSPVPMTGEPPWLESGDALPPGFDAVVPRDAVEMRGPVAEILASCSPGE